jgi:hypothetical protein
MTFRPASHCLRELFLPFTFFPAMQRRLVRCKRIHGSLYSCGIVNQKNRKSGFTTLLMPRVLPKNRYYKPMAMQLTFFCSCERVPASVIVASLQNPIESFRKVSIFFTYHEGAE